LSHKLPLQVHLVEARKNLEAALQGLGPLGFVGAILEDSELQALAANLAGALEPEAEQSKRADLVIPESRVRDQGHGLRGYYFAPVALANLLRRYAFEERLLWAGNPRPDLVQGLRVVSKVSVLSRTFPEGEGFLARMPKPQHGLVAVGDAQAEALAQQCDVILYGGGPLPLSAVQPYHKLIALEAPPKEVLRLMGEYVGPEEFRSHYLATLVDALGHSLPPDAFGEG
jgi:hypothetical protein